MNIRTSNIIERTFEEVKKRSKKMTAGGKFGLTMQLSAAQFYNEDQTGAVLLRLLGALAPPMCGGLRALHAAGGAGAEPGAGAQPPGPPPRPGAGHGAGATNPAGARSQAG